MTETVAPRGDRRAESDAPVAARWTTCDRDISGVRRSAQSGD